MPGPSAERVSDRFVLAFSREARALDLTHYGLEGLLEGKPTVLYHGTTATFTRFDLNRSRDELVNKFYGRGIFLTPSKRVAERYANANRNMGFDPSIIDDLMSKNRQAGVFMQMLFDMGVDGWDAYAKKYGFMRENPEPGQATIDYPGFQDSLKVDPNTIGDVVGYVIGSKTKRLGEIDEATEVFNAFHGGGPTGTPDYIYASLDEIGLDSDKYRPKIYKVSVTVENPLVTSKKSEAKSAQRKGYDSVIYYGSDLVDGVPEVAVYDSHRVKILSVDVDR